MEWKLTQRDLSAPLMKNYKRNVHSSQRLVSQTSHEMQHLFFHHYVITAHLNSDRHKKNISVTAFSLSLASFFKHKKICEKEEQLATSEVAFIYHMVAHSHSFRYMVCISKLLQKSL